MCTGTSSTSATSEARTRGDQRSALCDVRASKNPNPMPRNDPSRTKLVK